MVNDNIPLETWRLDLDRNDKDAWTGEKTVTFDRDDLKIIAQALLTAVYEGTIDKYECDHILDKLNIEHFY